MRDVRIEDPAIIEEIDLLSELVIMASHSSRPLSYSQIDSALGVHRHRHPTLSAETAARS